MIATLNEALAGRYHVESLAGRGGMASVYRATDLRHGRQVAIKVMHPEYAENVGRGRFLREIHVTAGLSHPHLLALYDSGEAGDFLFYVMPFVEGMSLRDRLKAEGSLPLDDVRKIIREAAEALAYAHSRGVIHRDIKPENILLAGYHGAETAGPRKRWNTLVADFGISALTMSGPDHLTATGIAVGSPQYMSPEQAVAAPVDQRTDIWALGCVAYEMLEGVASRGSVSFKRRDLSPAVTAAVTRAMNLDPALRFAEATDLADAMDDSAVHSGTRAPSRRRLWIAAGAILVMVGAAVARGTFGRASPHFVPHDSLAIVLYNRGKIEMDSRNAARIRSAFDDFSASIARDSGFAPAWAGLAQASWFAHFVASTFQDAGRIPCSRSRLSASAHAIVLDSSLADAWLVRARVMEAVDPTTRSGVLSAIHRALAIDSTNGTAWFLLGRAREELLDSAEAGVDYARAVHLAPTNLELLAFYGLHGLWNNNPRDGLRWADSAIALDATYELAREAAALLAMELHDWPAAERHVNAYVAPGEGAGSRQRTWGCGAVGVAAWRCSDGPAAGPSGGDARRHVDAREARGGVPRRGIFCRRRYRARAQMAGGVYAAR